jgi:ABC-type Zn uptake system ZnuABC Zn-binding protein ZnuA
MIRFLLLVCCCWLPYAAHSQYRVVATASIFADMAEQISGGTVEVLSVVPLGGDPHTYDPTPGDMQLLRSADLILRNGLTFEGWLDRLIQNSGSTARIITITEGIEPIRSERYNNATDPHAWMDVLHGLRYIENIKNALVQLDPDNQQQYEFNYGVYRQQLEDLHTEIQVLIDSIPEKQRILITSHDAFQYFGQRYGIRLEAVLGTSTDADVQTSDIARLTRILQKEQVPAIFIESTINPRLLQQLARDNKVRIGGELYSDSLGPRGSPASTYYDMLRHNARTISRALRSTEAAEDVSKQGNGLWLWLGLGALLFSGLGLVLWRGLSN